ncbi:MAG TPA: hypothetical protein VGH15_07050 [Caulobacteraceae bacterium]
MKTLFKTAVIGAAAVCLAAPAAWAGCGAPVAKQPASWTGQRPGMTPAAFTPRTIVGMWSVQFLAGGTKPFDFGFEVWHSDGTEILNSGGRAPSTENFCMGVWAQTSQFGYTLNHWALSYTPDGTLNAKVNIRQTVAVDSTGNSFTGPFTVDVYDPTGTTKLQHIGGRINGTRVTVF